MMVEAITQGTQVPVLRVGPITPDMVAAFAAIQRDHNPIHLSTEAAQAAGLAGPVVHGLFMAAQFERLLANWQGLAIASLRVQFVRPVPVGSMVEVSGRVLQIAEAMVHLRLMAKGEDQALVAIGEAKLRLPIE